MSTTEQNPIAKRLAAAIQQMETMTSRTEPAAKARLEADLIGINADVLAAGDVHADLFGVLPAEMRVAAFQMMLGIILATVTK